MKTILFTIFIFCTFSLFAQEKGATPINEQPTTNNNQQTFAVVVGISDYQDEGIPDLRFADKDAEAFAAFLQSPAGGSLDEDHLKVLINEQATMAQFAIALDWLMEIAKENDRVIIYFSGHGDVEKKTLTQPGFLLCWDAPARVYMAGGAFGLAYLQEVVSTLSVQTKAKTIVITDACRSGKLSGSKVGGAQLTNSNLAKQYANEIKILSCQPDEYSIEGEQWGGGRGAFSYHLLDGLTGMADNDADNTVNLKEIGRYLEDYVTVEVAPENQNPMVVGNKTEKLTDVFPEILVQLKEGKKGQLQLFTPTESRGIEDEVLAAADTNIVEMYLAFKQTLDDQHFLEPANACADYYYEKLSREPQLEKLHSSMRRNYAAALQDDAQQALNKRLVMDQEEMKLSYLSKVAKYKPYPAYLQRAADLLGPDHYMYAVLMARKLCFEGFLILLASDTHPNVEIGNAVIEKFRASLKYLPNNPHVHYAMSWAFINKLVQLDSAEHYAALATDHAPEWVLPYAVLANSAMKMKFRQFDRSIFPFENEMEIAKIYLDKALQIDSSLLFSYLGDYYKLSNQLEKAEAFYLRYIETAPDHYGGYFNLALLYREKGEVTKAEELLRKVIQMDSLVTTAYYNLARIYLNKDLFEEAEKLLNRSIELDSNYVAAYSLLVFIYTRTGRFKEAQRKFDRALKLDSTITLKVPSQVFVHTKKQVKTEELHEIIQLLEFYFENNPSHFWYRDWLGLAYLKLNRMEEAKEQFDILRKKVPGDQSSYICLGLYYHKLGEIEKAKQEFTIGIEQEFSTHVTLVQWFHNLNRVWPWMADLENNLKILFSVCPEYTKARIKYAEVLAEKGKGEDAFEELEIVLEKGYNDYKLLSDPKNLTSLKKYEHQWQTIMKKYFPDQHKNKK